MDVRSRVVRLGCCLAAVVLSGGAGEPVSPGAHCERGGAETVLLQQLGLPRADPDDRIVREAVDLVQAFVHARPRAEAIKASDYPSLPLAGLAGFRLCVPPTGIIDPEIYINTETAMYRLAADSSPVGLVAVAATVVHEMEHGKAAGEADAYAAEAAFVRHWVRTERASALDRATLERFLAALEASARSFARARR